MSQKSKKSDKTTRRQFNDEFKRDAVQMLLDGHPAASVVDAWGYPERIYCIAGSATC